MKRNIRVNTYLVCCLGLRVGRCMRPQPLIQGLDIVHDQRNTVSVKEHKVRVLERTGQRVWKGTGRPQSDHSWGPANKCSAWNRSWRWQRCVNPSSGCQNGARCWSQRYWKPIQQGCGYWQGQIIGFLWGGRKSWGKWKNNLGMGNENARRMCSTPTDSGWVTMTDGPMIILLQHTHL